MLISKSLRASIADKYYLYIWGNGDYGEFGNGTSNWVGTWTQIDSYSNWEQVDAIVNFGDITTVAIKTDGTLWSWGPNNFGQLGINSSTTTIVYSPVQVGTDTDWKKISAGYYHVLALKDDGTLWGWGSNFYGQLGLNDTIDRSSPVQIGTGNDWKDIAGATNASLAIKNNGTLWSWGQNGDGVLGQNQPPLAGNYMISSPVQVGTQTYWDKIYSIGNNAYAITATNGLFAWGSNGSGILGDRTVIPRSSPVQIGTLQNWREIASDGSTTHAVKTDNTLWGWGSNGIGRIGDNTVINRSSPVQIGALNTWAKPIMYGGVMYDGTKWQTITLLNSVNLSSPVQIGAEISWSTTTNTSFSNIYGISSDNKLYLQGMNGIGVINGGRILGIGEPIGRRSSPVQLGSREWKTVIGNSQFRRAIKSDGTLWAWGYNENGELGTNNRIYYSSPVQIGTANDWRQLGKYHALKKDGTLWGWGVNTQGALGDNSIINRSSPVQIGTETYRFVGNQHAIRTDGTLWGWGGNPWGNLGDNSIINRSSPVQIGTETWTKVVSVRAFTSIGLRTNGTLWSWGYNARRQFGQTGTGASSLRSSPVQIGTDTDWKDFSLTGEQAVAIKNNGTLWVWGVGTNEGTGNNNNLTYTTPVQVGSDTNWDSVVGDNFQYNVFVRKKDGTIWGWGADDYKILGDTPRSSPVQLGNLNKWQPFSADVDPINLLR